jgi:hypothetical protein
LTITTRPLDKNRDWMFFMEDDPIADTLLASIHPLTKNSASELWSCYISPDQKQRHGMLLGADHWIHSASIQGPAWEDYWHAQPGNEPDPVIVFLDQYVSWATEAILIFFWMKEQAVSVPWGVFRITWRNFLYDDEGPFLINPDAPEVVWFRCGKMGVVTRSIRPIIG